MCNPTSGRSQTLTLRSSCPQGSNCPLHEAMRKRGAFLASLNHFNHVSHQHEEKMRMSNFVKEVAESTANSDGISPSDVWENMLGSGGNGSATSYNNTFLKEEIDHMQQEISHAKEDAEDAADDLVNFIKSSSFQRHLMRYHKNVQMDRQSASEIYGVDLSDTNNSSLPPYREIDHYAAVFTEHLSMTDHGKDFLIDLLDDSALHNLPAFEDVWGFFDKVNSASEPMGKFVYNVIPVITDKINHLISSGSVSNINSVLNNQEVQQYIDFLNVKFGVNISPWLRERAESFGRRSHSAINDINNRNDLRRAIGRWRDLPEGQLEGDYEKLNGAWLELTFGIVAFTISTVKIIHDFKHAGFKDWVGLVNDFTGLMKTTSETIESRFRVSASIMRASEAGDEAVAEVILKANAAKNIALSLGVLAHLLGVVLSVVAIVEGIQSKDWDRVAVGVAGFIVSYVGFFAVLAEAAIVSGVCTILGLIIVVISAFIFDPPIIDYIEDTHWGEDHSISIANTISEFYKKLFKLRLRFEISDYDSNNSYLNIESNALNDNMPVYITIKRQSDWHILGRKAVYPSRNQVENHGRVRKNVQWHTTRPFAPRAIEVYNIWDIWQDINRDNSTEYYIKGEIDVDGNNSATLEDVLSDVTFPVPQTPILWTAYATSPLNMFENNVRFIGTDSYISPDSSGHIQLDVYTKYASGCKIEVKAIKDTFGPFNDHISTTTVDVGNHRVESEDLIRTTVNVRIENPPSNDSYDLMLKWRLLHSNGNEIDNHSTEIKVANQNYLDNQ